MRFGVNYTPRKDWFFAWQDPDWDSIKHDFDQIAGIGLDHIRIFHLWHLLQPNRTFISPKALADIRKVTQLAGEAGLDVYADVIQGHLSSFDFLPTWLLAWHRGNMFTDCEAIAAQADLVRGVYNCVKDLKNFGGLTLGNEVNQFSSLPHPTPMFATKADIENWFAALFGSVEKEAKANNHLLLHSCYDAVWITDKHPFTPAHASRLGDITSVHSWAFNNTAQLYGGASFEANNLARYEIELFKAFDADPNRQTWLQEIGAPLNVMSSEQAPIFCEESVKSVVNAKNLWGITWWCAYDVNRKFSDFPELEHTLGLFDTDGNLKPVGSAFSKMANEFRSLDASKNPEAKGEVVEIPVDSALTPLSRADLAPGGSKYIEWMKKSKNEHAKVELKVVR